MSSGVAAVRRAGQAGTRYVLALVMTIGLLLAPRAYGQPLRAEDVPPELRPWIPWVLDELGVDACPAIGEARVCAWLGRLVIDASAKGASFRLEVWTERRTSVPLPGSAQQWPQGVKVGSEPAVVLEEGGRPTVMLPAGAHTVEGRFSWRSLPEVLPVPPAIARVALQVGDAGVISPRRSDDGSVWLGGSSDDGDGQEDQPEVERLELEVLRRVEDGIPLTVTSQLVLRVGGRPREVRLEQPLLDGGELLSLDAGALSAHFEPAGVLVAEVKSGRHVLTLRERHDLPVDSLTLKKRAAPWPAEEVWAWAPDVALRQVEVGGQARVDPSQTSLPNEWRQLQAFRMRAPASLSLRTVRRGEPDPGPNQLSLRRQLWLDLDGEGFSSLDALMGTMQRDWRLSFDGQGELGRVEVRGASYQSEGRLITVDGTPPLSGVELRDRGLAMVAEWRGQGVPGKLPAVGWSTDVQALSVELNLPPGWELLGASGVDTVQPNRLQRWELFDLLVVLALALAVGKLSRWPLAPVAAVALALAHDSSYAPPWWSWALLLATIALLQRLGEGRARRAVQATFWAAAVTLGFLLLTFAAHELESLVYPHAFGLELAERALEARETEQIAEAEADNREGGTGTRAKGEEGSMGNPSSHSNSRYGVRGPADDVPPHVARQAALRDAAEFGMIGVLNSGAGGDPAAPTAPWGRDDSLGSDPLEPKAPPKDPDAVVQTGPGTPQWQYATWTLGWVGPVERGHQVRLWLLSPTLRVALSLLGLGLIGLVGWWLLQRTPRVPPSPPAGDEGPNDDPSPKRRSGKAGAAAAAVLAALAALGVTTPARAEAPRKELLDDLKARLTRAPDCEPGCLSVPRMTATVEGASLTLVAEVHAGALTSYQLPGPASSWVPAGVELDGAPSRALVLLGGHLHLRIAPGTHEVRLTGSLPGSDLTLALGSPPQRLRVEAEGWSVEGVDEDGHAEPSIRLRKTTATEEQPDETPAPEAEPEPAHAPPWLQISRTLDAGVTWSMRTTIRRVSAKGTPVVVRYPLLAGEKVTSGGFPEEGGALVVTLGRLEDAASFDSALPTVEELVLKAPDNQPWSEVWTIRCSQLWRCSSEGLAPVSSVVGGVWAPTFKPWPAEQLTLRLRKPTPAPGRSVTVRSARLTAKPVDRVDEVELQVAVHSSTGGIHALRIPSGVRVTLLAVNGENQPAEGAGGELQVVLQPGVQQVEVKWQQPGGVGTLYRTPEVTVGDQLVNAVLSVELPRDRWVLLAGGAAWAPDTQLWGYLLLLIAVGFGLGRLPGSPLKGWQWALLGVGFCQAPVAVPVVVGSWFFVVEGRKRLALPRRLHNATQIGVALWTLVCAALLLLVAYKLMTDRPYMMQMSPQLRSYGGELAWYQDRTAGELPQVWVLSTSVWLWRLLAAGWAAWVALLLWRSGPEAWDAFRQGGLWQRRLVVADGPAGADVSHAGDDPAAGEPTATDQDHGDQDDGDQDDGDQDHGDQDDGDQDEPADV